MSLFGHLIQRDKPMPKSTDNPTPLEIRKSESLNEFIKEKALYISDENLRYREDVIENVRNILNIFVKRIAEKLNQPQYIINNARGKLCTFGTYNLGVINPGANIDLLCVAPNYVTREQFFNDFVDILVEEDRIKLIDPIPKAHVPYIEVKYEKVECHLLFASFPYPTITEDLDVCSESNISNADEITVRSVNGCRTCEKILKLVNNVEEYRKALKLLIEWGYRRCIYSNKFGFFGGGNLSLLLCYISELYPNSNAFVLLKKFFDEFRKYDWTKPIEIMSKVKKNTPLDKFVFDTFSRRKNRNNKVILLTPSYPSINAAPNISEYSLKVLVNELERGFNIIQDIEEGKSNWDKLVEESDFFYKYNSYITITISAGSNEVMLKWLGFCESQIRKLVEFLGDLNKYKNIHLHPIGYYNPKIKDKNAVYFIGLEKMNKGEIIDITTPKNRFRSLINDNSRKRFVFVSIDMKIEVKECESIDLELYMKLHLSLYQLKEELNEEEKKLLECSSMKRKYSEEDEEVKKLRKRLKKIKIIESY